MREIAAGLASLGRGPDTMLVHMTPGEVQGLQALALSHGGSLTINPHTGLPEAGFLKNILPALAAAAAVYFTGGAAAPALAGTAGAAGAAGAGGLFGLGAAGTGALAGGVTGALTNKENPLLGALMGGLGGYGIGGGMGAAMQSGAIGGGTAAGAGMPPVPGNAFLQSGTGVAADIPASQLFGGTQLAPPPVSLSSAAPVEVPLAFPGEQYLPGGPTTYTAAAPSTPAFTPSADQMSMAPSTTRPTFMQALGQQFPTTGSKVAAGLGALGTVGAFDQPEFAFNAPQQQPSNYRKQGTIRREYDPSAPGGYYFTDRGILQPNFLAAKGGEVPSVPQLEDGGFVLTKKAVDGIGKGSNARGQRAAAAGLGAIPIKGPGTGTSDSIPTTIDGKRPALVSNGEAYVPRDQVKRRGGAKKFYALMKAAERKAARA